MIFTSANFCEALDFCLEENFANKSSQPTNQLIFLWPFSQPTFSIFVS